MNDSSSLAADSKMTNFDWAKLGIKLIGLWAMISSSRSVTNVVEAVYIN
jgi:hypothetical protein